MLLIIGLGNPGKEYERTRHNVGFCVVDAVAAALGASWKEKNGVALARIGDVLLAKPLTFMNKSGEALASVRADRVWAAYDDAAIDLGTIRLRLGGTAGGHKGVASLIAHLGVGEHFWRIRLGIGPQPPRVPLEDFVLQRFNKEERPIIAASVAAAADLILRNLHTDLHETTLRVTD